MNNEDIALTIDKQARAHLIWHCPTCGQKHDFLFSELQAGAERVCPCGNCLRFADDTLRDVQVSIDGLIRLLRQA